MSQTKTLAAITRQLKKSMAELGKDRDALREKADDLSSLIDSASRANDNLDVAITYLQDLKKSLIRTQQEMEADLEELEGRDDYVKSAKRAIQNAIDDLSEYV